MTDSRFDLDPEAVAWARGHVERVRDKWRRWEHEAAAAGDTERMMRARRIANVLSLELIGGEGCTITPFDHRRPAILTAMGETAPEPDPLGDHEFDLAREIIADEIAGYVDRAYKTCSAGLGALGDEPARQRAVDEMRHGHLAEPWLPAEAIARRLSEAGLLGQPAVSGD